MEPCALRVGVGAGAFHARGGHGVFIAGHFFLSVLERGGRYRVRERTVLRYYARKIQHLLVP